MARRRQVVWVIVGLVVFTAGAADVSAADRMVRPVRQVQDVAELGLSAGVTMETDGALAITATAGDLTLRKQVYADGRFVVRIATRGDDRLFIAGTSDSLRVAYGREATVELRVAGTEYEGRAQRVRGWLARSDAVHRLRHIGEALEQQDAISPEAVSLRVTGALIAELLGDPGAARRLSKALGTARGNRLHKVQNGQTSPSCWDSYQRLVMAAAAQLESCFASFAIYNPLRQMCAFVWTLQVESAWFQFLSCSSIPVK